MSPQRRAAIFPAAQAFMPSHLLFGWIGDRVRKPGLMAGCTILATAAMVLLAHVQSEWAIVIFTAPFSVVES